MSATDEEMHNADNLGIDHVTYALFDFSLSFLIYLVITFLVHLYSNSGRNAAKNTEVTGETATENGYATLSQRAPHTLGDEEDDGPEAYELTEHTSLDGDDDAVKIGGEDEVDWIDGQRRGGGVRL